MTRTGRPPGPSCPGSESSAPLRGPGPVRAGAWPASGVSLPAAAAPGRPPGRATRISRRCKERKRGGGPPFGAARAGRGGDGWSAAAAAMAGPPARKAGLRVDLPSGHLRARGPGGPTGPHPPRRPAMISSPLPAPSRRPRRRHVSRSALRIAAPWRLEGGTRRPARRPGPPVRAARRRRRHNPAPRLSSPMAT